MLKNKGTTILLKKLYFLLIPLLVIFFLGLPVADIAHGKVDKVSQELGAQGKGNAYGLQDKDKSKETVIDTSKDESYYTSAALSSATSAAPQPPILAILALIVAFGLKTVHNKRGK